MPSRQYVLEFTKMNGAGNDFVVVDNRFFVFADDELSDLARKLCPRRSAIGADGLLALNRPLSGDTAFHMRYFNADGSRAKMCGNGARCLSRFARLGGIESETLTFDSDAGLYRAHVPADPDADVRLFVPPPQQFIPNAIQDSGDVGHFIWTGTEHVVCFVPSVVGVAVAQRGPVLRNAEAFQPDGTNVNFVEVLDATRGALRMRTYERGVEAETLACGTGAMASALVARLTGEVMTDVVTVQARGGTLRVGFDLDGDDIDNLWLEGPAKIVYRGSVEL